MVYNILNTTFFEEEEEKIHRLKRGK